MNSLVLTEKQQEVLWLRYGRRASIGQIADWLKISRRAVLSRLRNAKKRTREAGQLFPSLQPRPIPIPPEYQTPQAALRKPVRAKKRALLGL